MYQAKTGQTPPNAMKAAIDAHRTASLRLMAANVANFGIMPSNLAQADRKDVAKLARLFLTKK